MSDTDKPQSNQNSAVIERGDRASISRREFARGAALTALAPAALGPAAAAKLAAAETPASAQAPASQAPRQTSAPQSTPPATPQSAPNPNLPKLAPESQAEADARAASILALYGSRFSDDQKSDIRRLAVLAQPSLDRLRAFHLANSDGEALYLKPLVEREKKHVALAPAASGKPAAKKP
jgi:hypothetical protein